MPVYSAASAGRKMSTLGNADPQSIYQQQLDLALKSPNPHTIALLAHNPLLAQELMDPSKAAKLGEMGIGKIIPQLKDAAMKMDKGSGMTGNDAASIQKHEGPIDVVTGKPAAKWGNDGQITFASDAPVSLNSAIAHFEKSASVPMGMHHGKLDAATSLQGLPGEPGAGWAGGTGRPDPAAGKTFDRGGAGGGVRTAAASPTKFSPSFGGIG